MGRLVGLSLLLVIVSGRVARAEPRVPEDADAQAKVHFARGQRFADDGHLEAALDEFSAGYTLSRRPLFLFNIGECARFLGNVERARSAYDEYLRVDPQGPLARQARERLAMLPSEHAPIGAPARLPELEPTQVEATVPRTGATYRTLTWVAAVVTVGGIAAATINGLRVLDSETLHAELARANQIESDDECAAAAAMHITEMVNNCAEGRRLASVTNVWIGASVAAALGTSWLAYMGYFRSPAEPPSKRARLRLTQEVYPGGAGLGAAWTF